QKEGVIVPARITGVRGSFFAWAPLLGRKFRGRTAVLSPFDRLIHDRVRSLELFDLDYKLEIYVPPAKRRWGYYVLPVLQGDKIIARFDARRDPLTSTFRVLALHAEPGATQAAARVVAKEVRALARWLTLRNIEYERVPRGWRKELEA
ncbi:MAG TPA: crosslink repair DNA glycosylase YcaQ family protein, partial [Candidatus Limnocylindrales bacterium]|nr:crosslink repair DNA glycosylase YcaQ family protein [Candidatus Limnocylindrales bacterium]